MNNLENILQYVDSLVGLTSRQEAILIVISVLGLVTSRKARKICNKFDQCSLGIA